MPNDVFPEPIYNYTLNKEAEVVIAKKAEELYEKRIAPYVKDISPTQREIVINFQKLVFTADHYFENIEAINTAVISSFFNKAEKFLDNLGMPEDLQIKLLEDMKDYAVIEVMSKRGKRLSEYDIRSFYFKKSCDVRMQRHLIRYLNNKPTESSESEVVRDILEEIEDDIDDIAEDQLTPFNGNRLLEILKSKDVAKLQEYISFTESLKDTPSELVEKIKLAILRLRSSNNLL